MHPNLKKLSNSAEVLAEACPRLYELDRLSPRENRDDGDVHLDFGTVVGSLVQDYLSTGNKEYAVWRAFLSYPRTMFAEAIEADEEEKRYKKDFWYALHALDKFMVLRRDEYHMYEVAIFDGKPAIELGFIIDCPGGFQYRGKLDAFLITKEGSFATLEVKTTGARHIHEAMFRHSGQGIGYSAVVDAIVSKLGLQKRESWPVLYPVYQTLQKEWTPLSFRKSKSSLANWIRHLLRTIQHISEYAEDNYFPMHGQNCFRYNKACRFFEQCEMSNKYIVGPEDKIVVKKDKEEDYSFRFSLDELIDAQLEKQQ